MGAQSVVFEIIHESLMNKDTELSVSALCEIAGVSRVSAEDARNRREQQDRADFELILTAYNFRGYKKGVLGVNMRLLHMGIVMNPKKIRRLMRKYNLFCPFRKANPYRQMAKALRTSNVAANLLNREFEAHGARAVLLTDITYMRFHDGFLYLSTILDAYTKEALAHVLSDSLEIDFVLETVKIMQRDHGISLQTETMIHSDQGCHYTSIQFIRLVNDLGLRQSMSRRGNCWRLVRLLQQRPLPVAAGEAVPETVLPLCHHRGVPASRNSTKGITSRGLCPRTPEVYRLFLRGSATGIGFRMAKGNEKERYRMASPPRKPAGARVAPQRCPILRLLTAIVYYLLPLFSTVQNSIVLDMGSTLYRLGMYVGNGGIFASGSLSTKAKMPSLQICRIAVAPLRLRAGATSPGASCGCQPGAAGAVSKGISVKMV